MPIGNSIMRKLSNEKIWTCLGEQLNIFLHIDTDLYVEYFQGRIGTLIEFLIHLPRYHKYQMISNLVEIIKSSEILKKNQWKVNRINQEIMGLPIAMENVSDELKERKVRMIIQARV